LFLHDPDPLPAEIQSKLDSGKDALRLLFVSHYNYYRNFETLLRAIPLLRERRSGQKLRLYLTCKFRSEENPGSYHAEATAALVQELGISEEVVELGSQKEGGVRLCQNPVCSALLLAGEPAPEGKSHDQSHGESLLSLRRRTSAVIPEQRRYSGRPCSQPSGGIAWQENL